MDLLTTEEAAELLRMTPDALLKARQRSQPPGDLGVRRGKRLLWRRSDLEAWVAGELGPAHLSAADAAVLELQAVNKLLRKMNAQLNTIALYLERAEARLEEPIE